MPYDPGPDVVKVVRAPSPGGAGGAYRIFGETLRGLKTTFGRLLEKPATIQYPEEKVPVYPRFRAETRASAESDRALSVLPVVHNDAR